MAKRLVLMLNGGGALGAYQSGVYRALVRHMDGDALRSMIVVGASSGAISGFIIAAHCQDADYGVAALEQFWRRMTQPSAPFFPVPTPYFQHLNGTLTGLAFGNPPILAGVPGGGLSGLLSYPYMAGFSNASLMGTVSAYATEYRSASQQGPRLIIRAVDIAQAQTVWFDSDQQAILPSMIGASSAIPLLCQPAWHDGRAYWDGDIWHQGIMPAAISRLRQEGGDDDYHIITAELFKRTPQERHYVGLGEYLDHFRRMFLGARYDDDAATVSLPNSGLRITRIQREPHPAEQVSSPLLDWSPERIEHLIAQGEEDAERALSKEQETATAQ
ncbi:MULTISPECIES: patatin-like phospholipase family protein [Halomonadaceae]|uniref:patatin-like phospholipase family protein n=1 Tax=Halomonadaceae TaxID=28256 RepID=UPI00159A2C92|nr:MULTISPECIES: patatin-like phospholipase family protein [Halomonas]QJQ94887.1 hypothetical protein HIO72_06075 [Halomonas sp. PA5]